jgi:hypothetical protein
MTQMTQPVLRAWSRTRAFVRVHRNEVQRLPFVARLGSAA